MKNLSFYVLLLCLCFFFKFNDASAQRIYGSSQQTGTSGTLCVNCIVNNPANAADGNPQTYSQINVVLGVGLSGTGVQTYQDIIFSPPAVAAGKPVHIKLGTGDDLLSLSVLGSIILRPYNGATAAGPAVGAATLVTALSNNNQVELTLTPTQAYDRVRVTLDGGLVGALSSIYLYDAWYEGPGPVACNTAIDELHGISSAILGLGVNVGGVANPQLAIDGNLNTASTLNAGISALGAYAQQTVIYSSPSVVGDSVKLTLSIPQSLIDAQVFNVIAVSTANGNTDNNDARFLNSSLLTVRLLDLTNNRRKVTVTFVPTKVFDRVQLRLGGVANVLSSLDFYEAQRILPQPVVTYNGGSTANIQVCAGTTATLNVTAAANTTYSWYTAPTGGTLVATGTSFTTPALTATTTYYVAAMRNGCTDASARTPVTINVLPAPAAPVIATTSATVCAGQTATFTAATVAGITTKWYTAATGGTAIFTGNTFTTPALSQTTSYYAESDNATGCTSLTRIAVTATVQPAPATPTITLATPAINPGQTNTLTITNPQAGVTYTWYDAATGGNLVFTGLSFTTPALNATTTYYVMATEGGCSLPARASVTVTVNAAPSVTVTPPTQTINSGQTATLTASSTTPNATFNWYTQPTGGTSIFTGATFTTPPLTTNTTYYAEAVDPVSGAVSTSRASGAVIIGNSPTVTVTPPTQTINSGQTATFTASSPTAGATFNWYTTPTGGTPIFTGSTFTSPALTANTTYYAEAVDPVTNIPSATRATGTVTIGNAPSVTVTPPTQAITSGQTATFTASSTTPNATFKWYSQPTGGAPIFTGPTFTTPPLTANTTYYAEAVDPVTNAPSATRATGTVTIAATPTITVTPPAQTIASGQTATFTASSTTPNATFNWYTTPTGGTPVFTGAMFTTPPLTANTTYYAEAVDPATNIASSPRATGTITIGTTPDITVTPPTQAIQSGQTATFTASSTTPNATFNWYTTPTGGAPVFTGATFTTPALTANTTYYAEAVDPATNIASSPRASGTVTIGAQPSIAVTPPTQAIQSGQTATFTASSTTPNATFNWYTTPTGGAPVFTGATFTTPALTANTTYYAEAVDPATNIASSPRASGTVTIGAQPSIAVTPPTQTIASGETATFTASSTTSDAVFNWYTQPTGGTPVFTGPTFTTPPLTSNTTYYAEAVDPTTHIASSPRATGTVTIGAQPNVTVTPPTQTVMSGQTATFTASSPTANATFNWYTQPTGGTPIFTGATFTTPLLTADITYYAEAVDPATNLASATRATGTVTVTTPPSITVTPPSQAVNSGQTATFTASSTTPNATFNWYTQPTGGNAIYTGTTFTTPALTANTTYYVEAVDPATGAPSTTRASAAVTIGNAPSVTVTPPTVTIQSGQTATFTASSTTPGATFNWYTTPTGGTPVYTGDTFTTPPVTTNTTYYAEAIDPATNIPSGTRATGTITIANAPDITVTPPSRTINSGQTTTFTASSSTANATFNWYTTPTGGTPVFTGATFTTPALTANTTYYAEAVDPATNIPSGSRATATVTIGNAPSVAVNPPAQSVNSGQTATFTATSTDPAAIFNWYTTPTGGTPVFTGSTFTTPPLTTNTTYYAEAVDPNTNIPSSTRASATITINNAPSITVNPPSATIASGQTATFTASSNTPNATFNWYTSPTGGNPVATGATFTTPPLTNNTTYYAEAVDPATGAPSASRATATVAIGNSPSVTVTPPTQTVASGQTATFTATSTDPGATFNWYTTPTGGTPIATGSTFTSPPVTGDVTYYAEAVDPTTHIPSGTRASGTIVVGNAPSVAVTPPSRTINSGQTATFTASSNTPNAIFNWYTTPTGGTPVFTGATFTTPAITANTTYYAEAVDPTTNIPSGTRATATVTIGNAPSISVNPPVQTVSASQTATFTGSSTDPGATFNWYTTPTGGTPIFTGPVFTTPPVTGNVTYYAEAVDPATNIPSATRAPGVVNLAPSISVVPPTQSVASGQTATITASSSTPGAAFNWYTTPTGGTPIFTGPVFTTPPVTGNVTYYAAAVDPTTGAISDNRAKAVINIEPNVTVTPPTVTINAGQPATFTATSTTPNATFNWYTTPTGGTPVFTGATFKTPAITAATVYYAEAVDPASGAKTTTRATATVALNPAPDLTVNPTTVTIEAGNTATFTASSTVASAVFNWYSSPGMESPMFTGPVFTTPQLNANATYWVQAVNPVTGAVSAVVTTSVVVTTNERVFVPNAFSPNGDGRNDTFNVYGASISAVSMYVYNQWGQLLFRTDNPTQGWDGTYKGVAQPVGVYVYFVKATLTDNTTISKKGTITLIR
ncbi:gliding motility-associated C-terminal domain-containing protein [Mucilaginibacter ginkgonis]|uniref:Gliding motility-associated C-terminal domain-containing protein n=1 Tax=Mucilaginibacter ginkgonis TaxID=2682091 RepID=A0A7T7FBP0_9SPHI|nr:gliding motility-associated C-terminal domain-containing protein [Mucilaginibacter ginkgonis]QQL50415.1 gliding motility-associated C-terminal domain-containing protein [Mucilaginibacter ginkgonis]